MGLLKFSYKFYLKNIKKKNNILTDQMSTSMYEVFHWDTEPTKPRLSLAPQTDPSLSQIDSPIVAHSVPQTPVHPKTFRVSHIGGEFSL